MDTVTLAPRKPDRRKLALAIAATVAGVLALGWVFPGLGDRLVYASVDPQCDGRFGMRGTVDGERVLARHCRMGGSTQQTESGYFVSFEYARAGQVLIWGRGQRPRDAGDTAEVSLAMVRTPGREGRWMCAGAGTWRTPEDDVNEVDLSMVGALLDERGLTGDGRLVSDRDTLEIEIGEWSMAAAISGWSCSSSSERCDVSASESAAVRAFVHADEAGELEHGFILREDQRAAGSVGLAVVTGDSTFTRAPSHGGLELALSGLSAIVECPQAGAQSGSLKLRWTD